MSETQPLSSAPDGAEYLRAVLRAPVYEVAQVTPLQAMEKLSARLDNHILVKREDRQPVHSFKLRGAYAMIAGLSAAQRERGVITASAGNHAQGWRCRRPNWAWRLPSSCRGRRRISRWMRCVVLVAEWCYTVPTLTRLRRMRCS